MKKRPLLVTIVSVVIAGSGAAGFFYHLHGLNLRHPFQNEDVWIALIRLLAFLSGIFMLQGRNWARWLAMGWIGFHVVVSLFHPLQLAVHVLVFALFA
jgi:hypothetical protein